jgi:signal transduction histidine kinase
MTDAENFVPDQSLLQHILTVSRKMAETRHLSPLLNYVMQEAIDLAGAERGFVVLVRPDETLDFKATLDRDGNEVEQARHQISTSVVKKVVGSGQPLIIRNAVTDPNFGEAESVVVLKLRSIMCAPLISRGETIGAVYLENRTLRNRFTDTDLAILSLFANQAAVAIENAALNDDLEARVVSRTKALEQANQSVEQSWNEAIKANHMRTVWLSKIAHDLRSPLGIASGALSLIKEGALGDLTPDQDVWIGKSLDAVLHSTRLTEDIFDLSRLDEGQLRMHLETVELKNLLQTVFDAAKGLAWAEDVEISIEMEPELPEMALDPVRIKQVLFNLLSNAQKFTNAGTVILSAEYFPQNSAVQISVADTGTGIASEHLGRLFDRFFRLEDEARTNQSGAGLGLAICRELVEMHGGQIWVESTPGVGSKFSFSLPTGLSPHLLTD